ncbi:MAG TPA: FAD-dependent oxidoreductase, partial [Thermoanaerobaculia bacterium]|nr:FAD-dependent oxidoreductase [Thermoanaerobaculia bacterium]
EWRPARPARDRHRRSARARRVDARASGRLMRVLVIGAGPMGIAAAIGASDRGHDVTVLEREEVGASLRTWGPARFFSPLRMNVSPRMRALLGDAMPDADALLTGDEYVDRVLVPLVQREPLRGRVRTGCEVVAIGRRGLTRSDYAGHPLRAERPFRVLTRRDEVFEADVILDASGGLRVPRAIGIGGLPARGESTLARLPIRTLGGLSAARSSLLGRRIFVLGDGHSAANAIALLAEIAEEEPSTRVIWAMRSANRRPCEEVLNDPLPERRDVVARANALAETPPEFLRVERKAMIESVAQNNGHVVVSLTGGRTAEADVLAAFTGYRPDSAFLTELTVETSPVTEGGARLYRAISNITDCLSVPQVAPIDLQSGEPNYFFVGSRSYGRSNGFLLQTGLAQLETILESLR